MCGMGRRGEGVAFHVGTWSAKGKWEQGEGMQEWVCRACGLGEIGVAWKVRAVEVKAFEGTCCVRVCAVLFYTHCCPRTHPPLGTARP